MDTELEKKINIQNKHSKYIDNYIKNDLFWGIGIENELYLEFENKIKVTKDFFTKNHKRERYSVNYFTSYKENFKNESFNFSCTNNEIELPLIINSHSFLYTDSNNNSQKKYTKLCEPNEKFSGKTLGEELINYNSFFKNTIDVNWLYDGDTIEFTTLKFYKVRLNDVLNELDSFKLKFIDNLQEFQKKKNIFLDYGMIKIMEKNHPFTVHLTNLNNIAIFNNGTLHYNITLPTQLNDKKFIKNKIKFFKDHKKAIKIIQWLEPFIICVYNTPDYFSTLENYENKDMYSKCSQRCAVSRYISIGTYDADLMLTGKILTISSDIFSNNDTWWYNKYHQESGYEKLNQIGLDINFNKYYNHGIELRFFDHITDSNLIFESFEFLIYLMDYILENEIDIENPIHNNVWNNLVYNIMTNGKDYNLSCDEIFIYNKLLNLDIFSNNIKDVYYEIYFKFLFRYNDIVKTNDNDIYIEPTGLYSKLTLEKRNIDIKYFETMQKYLAKINIKETIIKKKSLCNRIFNSFSCTKIK